MDSTAGAFDPRAQQCQPCRADQYNLNSSSSLFSCQDCPAGARCNGSSLQSLVEGAVWTRDFAQGVWVLSCCPPGYELLNTEGSTTTFSQVNQECSLCPTAFYCLGGTTQRSACLQFTYSRPGATSSSACFPAVFVEIKILIPMREDEVTLETKLLISQAIATACGAVPAMVRIMQVLATRRSSGNSVVIVSDIAAADASAAEALRVKLTTDSLNEQFASAGLPQGALISVTTIYPNAVNTALAVSASTIIGAVIGSCIAIGLVIVLVIVSLRLTQKTPETEDEKAVRLKIRELRDRFGINPREGFYLTTESVPLGISREKVTFLHRTWLEAAARLGLMQDFEVRHFDSLCTSLDTAERVGALNSSKSKVQELSSQNPQTQALSSWILEIAEFLITPDLQTQEEGGGSESVDFSTLGLSTLTARERFHYFLNKVCKCQIWSEKGDLLFVQLRGIAQRIMDEIAARCDRRTEELQAEPFTADLFSPVIEESALQRTSSDRCASSSRQLEATRAPIFGEEIRLFHTASTTPFLK
jgi:hypothetical protein